MTAIGEAAWRRLDASATSLTDRDLVTLSPLVVLAPHPDDETLGCGGLLAKASALGLAPSVVYLTDGAASHPNSKSWPPSRLAVIRRGEAVAALAALGADARRPAFLDWPDAAPYAPGTPAYDRAAVILAALLKRTGARSFWAPKRGESHCDHEAAAGLADHVCDLHGGLRRMDYLVWGWNDESTARARPDERAWRLACAAEVPLRRLALSCHRTQTSDLIEDADDAFLIPAELSALTFRPSEIYFERA